MSIIMTTIHCRSIAWGGERWVVSGELLENTWRETAYVVHTTIIILSSSVRWRRPWTGGESSEGWCERVNVRRRENAHERRPVGRAQRGGCERGFDGKTLSRAVRLTRRGGGQTSPSVGRRPARRGRSRLFLRVRSSVRITRSARTLARSNETDTSSLADKSHGVFQYIFSDLCLATTNTRAFRFYTQYTIVFLPLDHGRRLAKSLFITRNRPVLHYIIILLL